ncbi:hypothetical protein BaRGS_00010310 [Batillaria attramentaria]|uniref:Mediator of RNA polymerase II transcription subunit 1 n=1 Tax=Batillaria attramentaria TaxID=370345 RepID=A0ABD0LFU7_9CAEN
MARPVRRAGIDDVTMTQAVTPGWGIEDAEMKKKQTALMEKLRNKRSSQHRSWTESLKSIRTAVVDRRLQADSTERTQVQKCLDTLQRAMKVISQQSLVERLESVARQQTLTFNVSSSDPPSVTLQADMFYVEIVMNKGGGVKEVKVCHELTEILSRGDFAEFTSHLEGLQSIYKVTGEKKLKSKAYLALQSLERDLNQLAQFQNSISGVANYIHKSPLGILLPRTAGKPMKLIYFVSPYDLLDKKSLSAHPMTVEAITEHGLGRSVTVCLEPGPPSKLQTMPLLMVSKTPDSKSLPSFSGWNHMNSATLPACFVLVLPQPIPVATSVLQKIKSLTELDVSKDAGSQSLLSLILDSNSDGKMKKDQRLFVSLPDQQHTYIINGVAGGPLEEPGVMVSRIPFTHPTHVPQILNLLRQQLLFNSILASCVRPSAKKDLSCSLGFEMTVISLQQLMVVFEHPAYDTMVTVDVDMSDITSLKCRLLCSGSEQSLCSDDYAARVLQRCLSLPILLWSLVRKGRDQLEKLMEAAKARALEQARRVREAAEWAAQMRQPRVQPTSIPTKGRPPPPQPPPPQTPSYPPTPSPVTSNPPSVGGMGDLRGIGAGVDLLGSSPPGYNMATMGPGGDSMDKLNNPLLANLLDNERGHASPVSTSSSSLSATVSESPMLSKLLEDNISVATNVNPIPFPPMQQKTNKRVRKRRSQSELQAGRSPKRASDSEASDRLASVDFESSSSPFESSLGGSGGLTSFAHQMGAAPARPPSQGQMSGVIDLTDENNMPESSLKKLVDSVDSFMHKEGRAGGVTPDSELTALLSETDAARSPANLRNNQSTGPKNENASTSPEGVLAGSGEVGKASPSDPLASQASVVGGLASMLGGHKARSLSHTSPTTLAAFLGHGQARPRRELDVGLQSSGALKQQLQQLPQEYPHHPHQVSPTSIAISSTSPMLPRPKVVSSSSMTDMLDIKPVVTGKKGGLKQANSTESMLDKRSSMPGLFEKFEFTGQSLPSLSVSTGNVTLSASGLEEETVAPKVRLKLTHPFRTHQVKSQSLDTAVVQSPSSAGSKSSNSNTFDFRSDEEDDDHMPPMNYVPSAERLSVYSSSPTRLQISSKGKPPTPATTPEDSPPVKPEKYKRKDKGSSNSTKRKKDRDDSKKEKKKKKLEHMSVYQSTGKEPMYRAATIEGDQKSGTKLKIRVTKEPNKTLSPLKESTKMEKMSVQKLSEKMNDVTKRRSSSPIVEKLVLSKQDIRDHSALQDVGKDATQLYRSALASSGKSPKAGSGKGGVGGSNNVLSKADPKLAKATIRLKPLNIAASTSTSVTLTPSVKTASSSRSAERQRSQSSITTPVSTPTSGTLSLSSILPNAPTASSVASLPPIPKLSSSASATSASASSTGKTSSSNTNTAVSKNSSAGVNSSLGSASPKVVGGSPSVTSSGGGRPQPAPGTANATVKSSPNFVGAGANKMSGSGGVQKSSAGVGGVMHRNVNSTGVGGSQKSSGNLAQGATTAQKISSVASQSGAVQKPPGTAPNQFAGPHRMSNASNQTTGPQRGPVSGQGGPQRAGGVTNQGTSPQRTLSAGTGQKLSSGVNQASLQKVSSGTQQKTSNIPNQQGPAKAPGMLNQNVGFQKSATQQGAASHKLGGAASQAGGGAGGGGLQRTPSANQSNSGQKNTTQSGLSQKTQGTTTGGGQGQRQSGNQGRSTPSGGPSGGRSVVRNNSVSGSGGGRTPPNHLPINRSLSTPGQRSGSGSSPRTPAGQSPSTPSAPSFPNSSPQRSVTSSPSSVSQRTGNSLQANTSQKNTSSSQGQRQTGSAQTSASQRPTPSLQSSQRLGNTPGSSPNQRPASTPGISSAGDPRGSSGAGQSPGYPVRPSSAGPRQNSSPIGSRTSSPSSSGQRLSSSPSRTSSPMGHRQSSGSSAGAGAGISPLVSRSVSSGGGRDSPLLPRQNSSGSLNVTGVSRQNSSGRSSSSTTTVASNQTSSSTSTVGGNSSTPSRSATSSAGNNAQSVSGGKQAATGNSVNSTTVGSSSSVRQQSTTTSVSSSSVSRTSTGSSVVSSSGNPSVNSISTSKPASNASGPVSNKSVASGTSKVTASTGVAFSKSVASGASKVTTGAGAASSKTLPNSTDASNKTTASSGISGANTGKMTMPGSSPLTRSPSINSTMSVTSTCAAATTSTASVPSSDSAALSSSVTNAITKPLSATGLSNSVSSSAPTSTAGMTAGTTGSASKAVPAPRGRKNSLSAIVSKLATRVSAVASGTGTDGAESTPETGVGSGSGGGNGEGSNPQKVSAAGQARRRSAADSEGQGDQQPKAPVKRPASVSSLSPPGVEQKVQRLDSFSKPNASTPGAVATTMPSPAHSTPPQHLSSAPMMPSSITDKGQKSSAGERSSPSLREPSASSTHDCDDVGLDLSMPKDKARPKVSQPPVKSDSHGRVSPKESTVTPASSQSTPPIQGLEKQAAVAVSGTKFNGDSSREKPRGETEVFKVPTPKPQAGEEGEERGVGADRICSSRPAPGSPLSDASSPGNDLVIDCGESPNLSTSRPPSSAAASTPPLPVQPSPKRVAELANEVGVSQGLGRSSPSISPAKAAAPSPGFRVVKNSPQPSPHPKPSSRHNSPVPSSPAPKEMSTNSPCEIDDELMDAALMGFDGS